MSKPIDQERELKRCAACRKERPVSDMKTCMHNQMHRYVCDSKCMHDFYNPPKAEVHPAGVAVPEAAQRDAIYNTLRNYRMSTLDDGEGGGYPLIDAMTADGQTVAGGIEECDYLADALVDALAAAPHPVSGEQSVDRHNAAYWKEQYELLRKDYQRSLDERALDVANLAMVLHQNGQGIDLPHEARRISVSGEQNAENSDIEAMAAMLENQEWAEHAGKTPLGQRLESVITNLVNKSHGAAQMADMLETAHRFMESTEAFGIPAATGILQCKEVQWNVDESKALIAAHRAQQGEQSS